MTANLGSAQGMSSGVGTPIGGTPGSSSTSTIGGTSALASGFSGASLTTTTGGSAGVGGATGSTGSTGSSSAGMFGDSAAGGPIVGVSTARTGESITEPNQQTTYDTWEFWYDPRIELLKQGVSITGGGMSSTDSGSFGTGLNGLNGASGATGSAGTQSPTGNGGSIFH